MPQYKNRVHVVLLPRYTGQVVQQWKDLGKVLCRLLRMSDYWYGFASDQTLSSVERSARRISVLQQVGRRRDGEGVQAMSRMDVACQIIDRSSRPDNAGTENLGFSRTRQTLRGWAQKHSCSSGGDSRGQQCIHRCAQVVRDQGVQTWANVQSYGRIMGC